MKHFVRTLAVAATFTALPLSFLNGQTILDPNDTEGPMTNEQTYRGRGAPPPMPAPRSAEVQPLAPETTTQRGYPAPHRPYVQGPARGSDSPYNQRYAHRRPQPGYGPHAQRVWVAGHWRFDFRYHDYVWVPGRWAFPPRAGMVFVAGHWRRAGGQWVWVRSHWRPQRGGHAYHRGQPPHPGYRYPQGQYGY